MSTIENVVNDSTTEFKLTGALIQRSLYERVKKLEEEKSYCLDTVSTKVSEKATKENKDPVQLVVSLTHVILSTERNHLTGSALELNAYLERATTLTREIYDLSCVARNLSTEEYYKVSLQEAKRYGLL